MSIEVGDILLASWGYDQTNCNYYQVVEKTKTGKSIRIRPIEHKTVQTGFMCGNAYPIRDGFKTGYDSFVSDEERTKGKLVRINEKYGCVRLSSFASAYKVEDETVGHYESWYA